MQSIPLVNLVAVAHLFFVSVFIGLYMAETVVELSAWLSKGDRGLRKAAIKIHYWIDTFFEIPVLLCIAATGVSLAFLIENLTVLHWVKIGCVILMMPGGVICIRAVRVRFKMLKTNAPESALTSQTRRIIKVVGVFFNPLFTAVLCMGLWLAYHRVLESIYP